MWIAFDFLFVTALSACSYFLFLFRFLPFFFPLFVTFNVACACIFDFFACFFFEFDFDEVDEVTDGDGDCDCDCSTDINGGGFPLFECRFLLLHDAFDFDDEFDELRVILPGSDGTFKSLLFFFLRRRFLRFLLFKEMGVGDDEWLAVSDERAGDDLVELIGDEGNFFVFCFSFSSTFCFGVAIAMDVGVEMEVILARRFRPKPKFLVDTLLVLITGTLTLFCVCFCCAAWCDIFCCFFCFSSTCLDFCLCFCFVSVFFDDAFGLFNFMWIAFDFLFVTALSACSYFLFLFRFLPFFFPLFVTFNVACACIFDFFACFFFEFDFDEVDEVTDGDGDCDCDCSTDINGGGFPLFECRFLLLHDAFDFDDEFDELRVILPGSDGTFKSLLFFFLRRRFLRFLLFKEMGVGDDEWLAVSDERAGDDLVELIGDEGNFFVFCFSFSSTFCFGVAIAMDVGVEMEVILARRFRPKPKFLVDTLLVLITGTLTLFCVCFCCATWCDIFCCFFCFSSTCLDFCLCFCFVSGLFDDDFVAFILSVGDMDLFDEEIDDDVDFAVVIFFAGNVGSLRSMTRKTA